MTTQPQRPSLQRKQTRSSEKARKEELDLGIALASQVVKIDGESLTHDQWLDLDVRDDSAIGAKLQPFLVGPVQSTNEPR